MQNFFPKKILRIQKPQPKIHRKKLQTKNPRKRIFSHKLMKNKQKVFFFFLWKPYHPYLSPKPHDKKFTTVHTKQQKELHKKLQHSTTSYQSILLRIFLSVDSVTAQTW